MSGVSYTISACYSYCSRRPVRWDSYAAESLNHMFVSRRPEFRAVISCPHDEMKGKGLWWKDECDVFPKNHYSRVNRLQFRR